MSLRGTATWTLACATLVAGVAPMAVTSGGRAEVPRAAQEIPGPRQDEPPTLFDPLTIRDFRFEFDGTDWEEQLRRLPADDYVLADLNVDGRTYVDVGLRIKGNSSARGSGRKVPLNLTVDARVKSQELMGYDTLNLNSGFVNPTLTREMLTTGLLMDFLPMPKASYVRVHANGEYFGLYTLVQQIERTYLGEWFESSDGFLFKCDPPAMGRTVADQAALGPGLAGRSMPWLARLVPSQGDSRGRPVTGLRGAARPVQPPGGGFRSNLGWLGEDLARYRGSYELKTEDAGDAAFEKLREMIRVLAAPVREGGVTDADLQAAITQVLDVDGVLWYIAAHNLFTNFDSYYAGHNYYLYWAPEDERFHVLSWDVNESFGVFGGVGINPADTTAVSRTDPFLMAAGPGAASRPLISRLMSVPEFRADYLAHYRTLLGRAFEPALLEQRVRAYQDLIRDSVRADPNYIYSYDDFLRNVREDIRVGSGGRGGRAIPGLLKLATMRHAWLSARSDMQAPDVALAAHTRTPASPTVGDDVRIALAFTGSEAPQAVRLVYNVDGGRPIALAMSPTAGLWTATIPAQSYHADVTYFARVALADGRSAFYPAANLAQPWSFRVAGRTLPVQPAGDVVINELVADNETVLADEAGEFDDWVELYNRGPESISLSGYYLSDAEDDPHAYALPDVELLPGEYYLVWCDNDPEQGANHADFRLSKDGETVFLSTQEVTVDSVAFGALAPDVAFMRQQDGADAWVECEWPTPRRQNECVPPGGDTPTPGTTPSTPPGPAETATPTATPTSTQAAGASHTPGPQATEAPAAVIHVPLVSNGTG